MLGGGVDESSAPPLLPEPLADDELPEEDDADESSSPESLGMQSEPLSTVPAGHVPGDLAPPPHAATASRHPRLAATLLRWLMPRILPPRSRPLPFPRYCRVQVDDAVPEPATMTCMEAPASFVSATVPENV